MVRKERSNIKGVLWAIFGVVLFSSKAVMVKMAYTHGVDHLSLLLLRLVFSLPIYLIIVLFKRPKSNSEISLRDYIWVAVLGFVGYYLASLFDFMGLQHIKAGLERIILFIYPTLVVLLMWMIFGKKISKSQFWAISITYFGVVVIFWDESTLGNEQVYWGGFLIFLSALAYACYLVGSGWLIPKFGVLLFTSYAMIVSTCCIVVHYLISGGPDLLGFPGEVYGLGALMAIFATLLPSFMVSAAIQHLGASTFSIFGSLGPISTILLANLFLGESISLLQFLGMLIVIGGVGFVSKK